MTPGTAFSRYKILSRLGAGGMGEVFLGEDTRLGRKVALKLLPEEIAGDKDRLRRFEQEARAASALNHPNILTIHEFGAENDVHFLATEYIEGETLREKINSRELSLADALDVAEQAAFALSAAHAAGIVHRDIKPENIMIRRDSIVKILDFGLAKLTEKKVENTEPEAETRALVRTNPGVVMGTVSYMSPEQARGKETDARTDIWSLGVVLYEMLTGRVPFAGETMNDAIAAILTKDAQPLAEYLPNTSAELQRIVGKALRKDPDERYQHVKDLRVDLKDLRRELEFEAKLERSASPNANRAHAADEAEKPKDKLTEAAAVALSTEEAATDINSNRPTSSAEYIASEIKLHRRGFAVGLTVLILTAAVFGVWFFSSRSSSSNTAPIQSIAVLPFENASGNADLDYLSDGVSESVIDRLSQLPQLKVIARSSSFRYRGQNLNLPEIANALGVQAIITGRVVPRGDSYQIRVELVDVRDNKQLWGENFNRKASDVQILQADISREIAENLRLRLSGTQTQQLAGQGTTNPQAYELLLKARFYFNKAGQLENFHRAVEYYEQAIAADPNYALAYAELSNAYNYGGRGLDRKQRQIRSEATARKALELDPNLPEAHFATAGAKRDAWQWQEAEREYRRAIELNPNFALAHSTYADFLSLLGRNDEALAAAKRGLEINPLSLINTMALGSVYFRARRYDEAIAACKRRIEVDKNAPLAYRRLGDIYLAQGLHEQAIAAYQEAIRLRFNRNLLTREWAVLGAAYAKAGMRAKAEEILQKIKTTENDVSAAELAALYDALGMRDEAFALLEKAYAERDPGLPSNAVNPNFDNLRSDPRFQDLLRRMGLPQ